MSIKSLIDFTITSFSPLGNCPIRALILREDVFDALTKELLPTIKLPEYFSPETHAHIFKGTVVISDAHYKNLVTRKGKL